MLKTAYGVQGVAKRYYKSITFKNNKNSKGNAEIITNSALRLFTPF